MRLDVLFDIGSGPEYAKRTHEGWEEIGRELTQLGFARFAEMSVKTLRGDLWARKKCEMLKRYDASLKTGTGSAIWKPVCIENFCWQ